MRTGSNKISCILCIIILAVFRAPLSANDLDIRGIANILGYPESEMVITDVTDQQKFIYSKPTLREAEDKLKPPVDPTLILASYRITGKLPYSFYPILITIAKEGAFLSDEFKTLLDKASAYSASERSASGYSFLGPIDYEDAGKGGIMLMEYRVPSHIKEMSYPSEKMGTISEIRVPKSKIDIRIAISLGLDEGGQYNLIKIAGGERYHGYFRKPAGANEDPWPEAPDFNWSDGFKALNLLVLNTTGFNKTPPGKMSDSGESNPPPSEPEKTPSTKQNNPPSDEPNSSTPWGTIVVLILAALGLMWMMRKRRS